MAITSTTRFLPALALLPALFGAPAGAQDPSSEWSRFRGPNGSGVAEASGLPVRFGPDQNVVWKTELPPGHSSPVLSGQRVFITAFADAELLTYCLDGRTGQVLWRRAVPRERQANLDQRNNAASPTPAVDSDTVVVFFEDFGMIAYDHAGSERWRMPLGPFDNIYGMGASPVLFEDLVFLACDQSTGSFLIAASKADGEVAWRVDRPQATSGHCTPIIYQADGGPQLVLPGSFTLDSYDLHTGEKVWWVRGLSFEMKSVPVLSGGTIYINGYGSPLNDPGTVVELPPFPRAVAEHDADGDGAISRQEMPRTRAGMFFGFVDLDGNGSLDERDWEYLRAALTSRNGLLAITAGGSGDMTQEAVVWAYRRTVPQLPSPLIYGDVLYMLHDQGGLLATLQPQTGEVIERGRVRDAIDNYFASPVAGDGKVYLVSESGLVSVLRAGGGLETLAVNNLDEPCYATPAIADGRIYLRTASALFCFGSEG